LKVHLGGDDYHNAFCAFAYLQTMKLGLNM
jgi:hypothetical protein